jgi:UPF0755 protein
VTRLSRRGRRLAGTTIVLAVVAILVVAVVGIAHVAHSLRGGSSDYSGSGSGTVLVVVHAGDTSSAIADTLVTDKVVRSAGAFTAAAEADARSRRLGPGTYRLHQHMQASLALSLMLKPSSLVDYKVTIPEGFTAASIVARIAADTPITSVALKQALAPPVSALGLPSYANGHPEGFLYPATYDVQPGTTAAALLREMVARYQQEATALHIPATGTVHGLTAYQIVTLASIVQREGRLVADYPKIAEVFANRMAAGMPLGSDATLFYALGPNHGPLTNADLQSKSPYNTRTRPGLPPTPINSPGEAALKAVLHHPAGPLLYFVTIDKAGHTAFATTLDQFNALVMRSRANGVS